MTKYPNSACDAHKNVTTSDPVCLVCMANEIESLRAALAEAEKPVEVWVLTSEYNEYDQQGEYFEEVFSEKPTLDQIKKVCGIRGEYASHILNGGGRKSHEHKWYHLRKHAIANESKTRSEQQKDSE